MKKFSSLCALGLLLAVSTAGAANLAADNSLLYAGMWPDGSNNGFGFAPWSFDSSGTNSGRYIGGSGLSANSFAIFAADPGSSSGALRPFTGGPLLAGQTFSISIGYNAIAAGGVVGFDLRNSSGTPVFTVVGDGIGDWQLNDGGMNFSAGVAEAANTPFVFTFTYNGGSSYSYTFGTGSGNNFGATNNITDISQIRLFSSQQGSGNNFGFDNLTSCPSRRPGP